MKRLPLFIALLFFVLSTGFAGTGPTHCQYSPFFRENVTIKTDISSDQLRIDKEASFRVYLKTTMNVPFYDAKLDVLSEQFDATVSPSPTWKGYPDVTQVGAGGNKEYFTVTLKRKKGVPDGKYDISLKLYSSRRTFRRLAFFLPLAETVDAHTVPVVSNYEVTAKPSPQKWGNSALVNDFWAFKQITNGERKSPGLSSYSPSAQTRIHLMSNAENVFLLAHLFGGGQNDNLKIYVASEIEAKPVILTLDSATSKISSNALINGLKCVKCEAESGVGVTVFEIQLPRKALGIDKKNSFFMNFSRTTSGLPSTAEKNDQSAETSFWRGNALSVDDPVVYGKMIVRELPNSAKQAAR